MAVKLAKPIKEEKPVYLTYEDYDPDDLYFYAGLDCIATSTIAASMFPWLVDEPVYNLSEDGTKKKIQAKSILQTNEEVTKLAFEYILDLEINGLKYDVAKNREISAAMMAEVARLDELLVGHIPANLNLSSGTAVAKFLYQDLGFTPEFFTQSGEPSTDGNALLSLAGLNPLAPGKYITPDPKLQFLAHMAKRKDIDSSHNTFVKTYVEDFVKRDGRVHPSYNLHGTSGFRISGESPNLTQLPRPKHGFNIRDCFTIEDGYCFIAFDFSSAEVKILAALCKDENMLKAVREGLDFHSFSASSMIGMSYEEFIHILEDKEHPRQKELKGIRQTAKVLK